MSLLETPITVGPERGGLARIYRAVAQFISDTATPQLDERDGSRQLPLVQDPLDRPIEAVSNTIGTEVQFKFVTRAILSRPDQDARHTSAHCTSDIVFDVVSDHRDVDPIPAETTACMSDANMAVAKARLVSDICAFGAAWYSA